MSTLGACAASFDLQLTDSRLAGLTSSAGTYLKSTIETGSLQAGFKKDGLIISKATDVPDQPSYSSVHFTPRLPGERRGGATTPQRGHATAISLSGVCAAQDYVLLCEAGYIEPPEIFLGHTNQTMARVAARLGFEPYGDLGKVGVQYETLREKVFSPDTRELQIVLSRRLGRTSLL